MHRLARILLQMQPFDANVLGGAIFQINGDDTRANDRLFELGNLIALRQIRIEIVLPVKDRIEIDLCAQRQTGADCLFDTFVIDDRQHARQRRIHEADLGVGFSTKACWRT